MSTGRGGREGDAGPSSSGTRPSSGSTIHPKMPFHLRSSVVKEILAKPARVAEGGVQRYPYLLLDCRTPQRFANGHLKSEQCVNIEVAEQYTVPHKSSGKVGFESKAAVVNFLRELSPEVLGYLHKPGDFQAILIVTEDYPERDDRRKKITWLHKTLCEWNEDCDTLIGVFAGKIEEFRQKNPDLVTSEARASSREVGTSDDLASMAREHLGRLDEIAALYKGLLSLKWKTVSLKQIQIALSGDEREKREALIPEMLKCTSCRRVIFRGSGKIFMCAKGHPICGVCLETADTCAVEHCQESFDIPRIHVNSKAEKLRASVDTDFDCCCDQSVAFRDIKEHLDVCVRNAIREEVTWIDGEIEGLEDRIAADEDRASDLRKRLVDEEQRLVAARNPDAQHSMNWADFDKEELAKEKLVITLKKRFFLSKAI